MSASDRVAAVESASHPRIQAVFSDLDRRGVTWCVLRDADELDTSRIDVSVLILDRDRGWVGRILTSHGYLASPGAPQAYARTFVTFSEPDGVWIRLRFVTRLDGRSLGALPATLAPALLERRRSLGGVAAPAPEDDFWALWLHCLLDDEGVFAAHHVEALERLAPAVTGEGPVAAVVEALLSDGWDLDRIRSAVLQGSWEVFDPFAYELRRTIERQTSAPARVASFGSRWSQPFMRLSPTGSPGITVALLAPDGAGKSTAVERLSRAFPLPVRTVYMGLYGRDQPPPPALVPGMGTLIRMLRQWRGYLVGRRHRRGGDIVLFDRYCYDARLPGRGGTLLRRMRTWMLGHACPPPDLTVVLDASGEVLHRRKPEHRLEELEQRRQGYLFLAARYGWVVVDASRDVDQVNRELTGLIWRAYRERATATRAAKSSPRAADGAAI